MSQLEFIIQPTSVNCPSCNEVFATQIPFRMSEMTPTLPVEADLHRVLPYGAIRACLITICPQCQYSWWTNTFNRHYFLPVGIAQSPIVDYAKRFAHAILTGRKNNFHILDRALLALNGYWCAKESNQEINKWLTLAIQELSAALADNNWQGNRSRYHYLLAELLRLNGRFEQALHTFNTVNESAKLPNELIEKQKNLASRQNSEPTLLTNKEVQEIFFPKLVLNSTNEEIQEEGEANRFTEKLQSDLNTTAVNQLIDTQKSNFLPPKRTNKATV
jgi:hypothetical protein